MAHIVIIGAGLGGMPMAYEMKHLARPGDKVTVVSNSPTFHFVPSNPWVAVNWRMRDDIEFPVAEYLQKKGINFNAAGVKRVRPDENRLELGDGSFLDYDFLVIATGPRLAFEEVEGLGPQGHTQSVCHVDHAVAAGKAWTSFVAKPGPIVVGAVQGASCYGPAYEFAFIMETDLRRRKIRDRVPRNIKWICNAKTTRVEAGKMYVTEYDEMGKEKRLHELPFGYSMMLPAFKGVDAVAGIEGLVNPRGFVLIDEHQRNPTFKNIYSVGVCVAIPPVEQTPVPTGAPKTGYMIESMVTATAHNIRAELDGRQPEETATWNALCLADFGDTGVAFVALPQIPPRNVNWFSEGRWVHLAKVAFEKYFIRKMKKGTSEPLYEKLVLHSLGIRKLKT